MIVDNRHQQWVGYMPIGIASRNTFYTNKFIKRLANCTSWKEKRSQLIELIWTSKDSEWKKLLCYISLAVLIGLPKRTNCSRVAWQDYKRNHYKERLLRQQQKWATQLATVNTDQQLIKPYAEHLGAAKMAILATIIKKNWQQRNNLPTQLLSRGKGHQWFWTSPLNESDKGHPWFLTSQSNESIREEHQIAMWFSSLLANKNNDVWSMKICFSTNAKNNCSSTYQWASIGRHHNNHLLHFDKRPRRETDSPATISKEQKWLTLTHFFIQKILEVRI